MKTKLLMNLRMDNCRTKESLMCSKQMDKHHQVGHIENVLYKICSRTLCIPPNVRDGKLSEGPSVQNLRLGRTRPR